MKVQELMTPTPQCVTAGTSIKDDDVESATERMEEHHVRRPPVLDRNRRMVGIVSLGDIAIRIGDSHCSDEVLERVSDPTLRKV